jgi:hypothetical protein
MRWIISWVEKLFGHCEMCDRWLVYPKRRHMNTMYVDEESNYITVCADCFYYVEEILDERWSEYNNMR